MTDASRILLRDATVSDIPALAELHVRTFDETHGPGPRVALRERQWHEKFARPDLLLFCVVLEDESGSLIGFASGEPHRTEELAQYRGELDKIYLLREYHRVGLGRRLLCAAARQFLDRGIDSMLLFGDARSPTNGFYERMGGERLFSAAGEFHGAYGWRDLRRLITDWPPEAPEQTP
jgi:ribosomal protein S18 acetylase RimI-like enzyme